MVVTGCLAERYRSQIEEEIPEVDAVVGCASNKAIDSIVARLFNGEEHLESYGLKKTFLWAASASSVRLPTMRT